MKTKVKELIKQLEKLDQEQYIVTNNGTTNRTYGDKIKLVRNKDGYMIY